MKTKIKVSLLNLSLIIIYLSLPSSVHNFSEISTVKPIPQISIKKCLEYLEFDSSKPSTTSEPTNDSITNSIINAPHITNISYLDDNYLQMHIHGVRFIVGGDEVRSHEFPHMAALGFAKGTEKQFLCGGSLISELFVLTAAHCLYSQELGPVKWVRLGAIKLSNPITNDFNIIKLIPHPKYTPPAVYNDIALVKLDRNVQFGNLIKPACLHSEYIISQTLLLQATGWGLTQIGGSLSNILRKVTLGLFSDQDCGNSYEDMIKTRKLKNGIVHAEQFCAGSYDSNKDTCQGDSGGPLQYELDLQNTLYAVVGVTSFAKTCGLAKEPGVYTRVSEYVPWIESVIWPNEQI